MPRKEENKMLKRNYKEFFLKSSPETANNKKKAVQTFPPKHTEYYTWFVP